MKLTHTFSIVPIVLRYSFDLLGSGLALGNITGNLIVSTQSRKIGRLQYRRHLLAGFQQR